MTELKPDIFMRDAFDLFPVSELLLHPAVCVSAPLTSLGCCSNPIAWSLLSHKDKISWRLHILCSLNFVHVSVPQKSLNLIKELFVRELKQWMRYHKQLAVSSEGAASASTHLQDKPSSISYSSVLALKPLQTTFLILNT